MRLSAPRGALPLLLLSASSAARGSLVANQSDAYLLVANDRLTAAVNKSSGAVFFLTLDGQDLLGTEATSVVTPGGSTGNGVSGVGPYLDCYCTPKGAYTPGADDATYLLHQGVDSRGVAYGGIVMSQTYAPTGLVLEQYWFLRDGETGLHTFTRVAYHNDTAPHAGPLQELRTLFRPNADDSIWTHLVVDDDLWAPLPVPNPAAGNLTAAVTVQDATWDLGARGPDDPYVAAFSDYFTKYTFSTTWRDQVVHGMYADGSRGRGDGTPSAFGSWLVMNTKDTYFGGPTWSDLTVDGIVYNYLVSNHHGDQAPNITNGLDRTFGPSYYHFNRGPAAAAAAAGDPDGWRALRDEAVRLADPAWNARFYDDVAAAGLVPGLAPSAARGRWRAVVDVPPGARAPVVAVLSAPGRDFQDNAQDPAARQYWADVDPATGAVALDRVLAGAYRLTVYAAGVFGSHVQEGVVVEAGRTTDAGRVRWVPESAGRELWRIGVPDKAGGEWLHGDHPDPSRPLHPPEYRIYWAAYDYLSDFPDGVRFHVGRSDEARDWNYIHWSVFGGYANARRPAQVEGDGGINNWTVLFDVDGDDAAELAGARTATLTVQLAAAKGASGNTDVRNETQPWADLPYVVVVNGRELETWVIPYYQSSSCGARSAVSGCYDLANKWEFPASYLRSGANATNEIVLSLPYNATDYESALLPRSVYVQYDALRLEVR